ncbi:hypothetical protein PICSAR240_04486 [Mycobacterium avium subsp. paratuberculosis]|nr:hypothetical protein PICSAR118_04480 [Mycobacterium avium subsp. paratuberculosis]CAG6935937.1 hypothetical protein PICSAR124B_04521 [Mycobacterium avium subsp. paratuberculosis]CAG6935983.1 hypothetical protein PICSAR110_04501 [Mycobacterium avium subsp. paratuberculosis]CAG6936072.1 hypothetical protein PICSAR111_04479 [Mycobacterium avium subsp. paratuberculosis]CAG6936248.1 hypothetical protein PICSAR117_04497 [Mycobacterium avium subsp. paratuberculosis]
MGAPIRFADRIAFGRKGFKDLVDGWFAVGRRHGHRCPGHLEQPVGARGRHRGAQLALAHRTRHHRAHRQHRQSQPVGQLEGNRPGGRCARRLRGGQAGAYRRRPGGVQRHALPRERQHHFVSVTGDLVADDQGVHGRVEQRRVHTEPGDAARGVGQPHLGEHLVAAHPRRGQALEGRAVAVAARGQPLVAVRNVDLGGPGRRPRRQIGARLDRSGAQRSLRVAHPRRVAVGPREDGHVAPTGFVGLADHHLHGDRSDPGVLGRQHQRSLQRQLLDRRTTDFVAGADRQLHETGSGEDDRAGHGVIGQPALQARGQPAGQHHPARGGQLDDRAEQRVLAGAQAQAAGVGRGALAGQPKPAAVKGIRGQLHEAGSVQHTAPRHVHSRDEGGGRRRQEPLEPAVVAAQGGNDDGLGVTRQAVVDGVLDPRDQRRMRTGFDEGPVSVLGRAAHRLVELHGLPDVAVPVVGVQSRCVQAVSGHRGEEGDARGTRLDTGQRLREVLADRLDLDRM